MRSWYRDRRDGFWTLDLDPDFDGAVLIEWAEWFPAPVSSVAIAETVPEIIGPGVVVTVANFDNDICRLAVRGSGGRVTLAVAHASAVREDLTLRFRARQS